MACKKLLEFSRQREFKRRPLDLNQNIEKSISLLGYQAKMDKIKIVKELGTDIPNVAGDEEQLQQVFLNIMLNAVQAMENGGTLTVRSYCKKITRYGRRKTDKFKRGDGIAVIEFGDTGEGMDDETLKKLFSPFFTTKEKGVGLGLFVSYGIIEKHAGVIEARSKLGEGSTLIVKLPIMKGAK